MMDACAFSLRQHFRLKGRRFARCRRSGCQGGVRLGVLGRLAGKQWEVSNGPDGDFREPRNGADGGHKGFVVVFGSPRGSDAGGSLKKRCPWIV